MWPFKKKEEELEKCLVCHKMGEHTASVQYLYKGGRGLAYLCGECAELFESASIDMEDEYDKPL